MRSATRFNVTPRIGWLHDVVGVSPGPLGSFVEGRQSLSAGVNVQFLRTWSLDLSYTSFFGAARFNTLNDRDFLRLNLTCFY